MDTVGHLVSCPATRFPRWGFHRLPAHPHSIGYIQEAASVSSNLCSDRRMSHTIVPLTRLQSGGIPGARVSSSGGIYYAQFYSYLLSAVAVPRPMRGWGETAVDEANPVPAFSTPKGTGLPPTGQVVVRRGWRHTSGSVSLEGVPDPGWIPTVFHRKVLSRHFKPGMSKWNSWWPS